MANGSIVPLMGANVILNRLVKSVPDYSAPSVFKVGVTTDDVSWNDTELNDVFYITSGVTTKLFESITIDEVNSNIIFQGWLSVTEANSALITGFGVFNTDTAEKLVAKSKFTGVSKTNTKLFKISLKVVLTSSTTA